MKKKTSIVKQFDQWTIACEKYRFPYLVTMLLLQGNITVPFTLWALYRNGFDKLQVMTILLTTFMVLVANLAAMPTRVTIRIFIFANFIAMCLILFNLFSMPL